MKRLIIVFLLVILNWPLHAMGGGRVTYSDFKEIKRTDAIVKLSWEAEVSSDENLGRCTLIISFREARGFELAATMEHVVIPEGSSLHTGTYFCKPGTADKIRDFKIILQCFTPKKQLEIKKSIGCGGN